MHADFEPHPIALKYPPLSPDELRTLGQDIKSNGLRERIVLIDDQDKRWVLDGRSRMNACVLMDVELTDEDFEIYTGDDPEGFVASKNLHRRHLRINDYRKLISERKALAKAIVTATPERTDRSIAKDVELSHVTVAKVRHEVEAGAHEAEALPNGTDEQAMGEAAEEVQESCVIDLYSPPPRVEKSGRKARGRKPGKAVAKAPKETKPKPLSNPRDEWIGVTSKLLATNTAETLRDIVQMVKGSTGTIVEVMSQSTRADLVRQFAGALAIRLPGDF
jgi:hypothetical protein